MNAYIAVKSRGAVRVVKEKDRQTVLEGTAGERLMCPGAGECDDGVGDKRRGPATGVRKWCKNDYVPLMEAVRFLMVSQNEYNRMESDSSWEAME